MSTRDGINVSSDVDSTFVGLLLSRLRFAEAKATVGGTPIQMIQGRSRVNVGPDKVSDKAGKEREKKKETSRT